MKQLMHKTKIDKGYEALQGLYALLTYAAISIALFGKQTIFHLNDFLLRSTVNDSGAFVWFLNWWPYAIDHKLNFFISKEIWVPTGFNMAHATAVPFLSLISLPITLFLSPIVAFNLIAIFTTALSAWTAYLLCKYITKSFFSSLLGGYFFGFSAYQIFFTSYGDINITSIFLIPVLMLLALFFLHKKIRRFSFTLLTTICLVCQFLISVEIFLTSAFFAAIFWYCAIRIYKDYRAQLLSCGFYVLISYLIATIIVSPYIYYFFLTPLPDKFMDSLLEINTFAGLFIPAKEMLLHYDKLLPYIGHFGPGYLGIPAAVVLLLFSLKNWGTRQGKLLIIFFLIVLILSFGFGFEVFSKKGGDLPNFWFPLPAMALHYIPVIKHAMPFRFIMYATLSMSVIMALWLSAKKDFFRYTIAFISILFILPTLQTAYWSGEIQAPRFFTEKHYYEKWLKPKENVLILPFYFYGYDMLWQIEANMYFRQLGGFASAALPYEFRNEPMIKVLMYEKPIDNKTPAMFKAFLKQHGVTAVIVDPLLNNYWKKLLVKIQKNPFASGGVLIYKLSSAKP